MQLLYVRVSIPTNGGTPKMNNPQHTAWLESLGIGTNPNPYVKPIDPPVQTDDDDAPIIAQWDTEEEIYSLVTNA
jgi:hypothetical protein